MSKFKLVFINIFVCILGVVWKRIFAWISCKKNRRCENKNELRFTIGLIFQVRNFFTKCDAMTAQRFKYGAFGILTLQSFNLLLCSFIVIIFIISTICQMHYIFCYALLFFSSKQVSILSVLLTQ